MDVIEYMIETELGRFSTHDYRGLPDVPAHQIVPGTLPVIFSAPHAVSQLREGRIKPSDDYTGALALAAARIAGCHAIVASRYDDCDPNYDPLSECTYKQALVEHVRTRGIRLVIDVHGVPSASPCAIEIGTADGATEGPLPGIGARAKALFEERLTPYLAKYDKRIALNERYGARGGNTVTRTLARECGIAALQLEISSRFRVPSGRADHLPAGERMPFTPAQLGPELSARRNPDCACVEATVRALAALASTCS